MHALTNLIITVATLPNYQYKYELIHSHMHKHFVSPLCTRLWSSVHQKQVLSDMFVAVRKTRHDRIQRLRGSYKLGVNYVTVEL